MHGVTFNNPKTITGKMLHGYEQEFGDIRGLSAQNNFPSIFPKH